jgi:hypothetical protein
MNAFRFAQACEEYETGLTVMLRVARSKLRFFVYLIILTFSSIDKTDPTQIKILREVVNSSVFCFLIVGFFLLNIDLALFK